MIDNRSIDQDEVHTQPQSDPDQIAHMTLNEFATSNVALKVDSSVLGETIYFVSNNTAAEKIKGDGFVTYTAKELEYLAKKGLTPEELKKIHVAKTVFPGSKLVN